MKKVKPPTNLTVLAIKTSVDADVSEKFRDLLEKHSFIPLTSLGRESIGIKNTKDNKDCLQSYHKLLEVNVTRAIKKIPSKALSQKIKEEQDKVLEDKRANSSFSVEEVFLDKETKRAIKDKITLEFLESSPIETEELCCRVDINKGLLYIPAPLSTALKVVTYFRLNSELHISELKLKTLPEAVITDWVVNGSNCIANKCTVHLNEDVSFTVKEDRLVFAKEQCSSPEYKNPLVVSLSGQLNNVNFTIDTTKTKGISLSGISFSENLYKEEEEDITDAYACFILLQGLVEDLIQEFGGELPYKWETESNSNYPIKS